MTTDSSAESAVVFKPSHSFLYPGYRKGTLLVCGGMIVSILLFGLRMPYYNKAASDMVSVYEALTFNSKLPQEFLVYPGLISRALLGWWFAALKAVGFLPLAKLEQLQVTSDLSVYESMWQQLVEAGRVFSLLQGIICVAGLIALIRRWLGIWQIAVLAGVAIAFSSGFALGFRILRPEMMTASLVFGGLLLTLISANERSVWRFAMLAGAGFAVSVAILDKVQSIIPALAILPIALSFGPANEDRVQQRTALTPAQIAILLAIAALALYPAAVILGRGIALIGSNTITPYKQLSGGLTGHYQWIIAAGIAASMAAYAKLWRISAHETILGMAAVGAGLGCGFDLLYLQESQEAIIAVANPVEHLQAYSAGSGATLLTQSPFAILQTLAMAAAKSLAIHSFVFSPMHRPTLIVEWLAWAGAVVAYRSDHKLLALQIALLLGCGIAEDAIFSLRQVKVYYLPYSDLPIILAGALALTQFKHEMLSVAWQRVTLALIIITIVWGHAQPALAVYSRHERGKVCGIVVQFTTRIKIPYCDGRALPTNHNDFDQ